MKKFMLLGIFASLLLLPAMAFADKFRDCDRNGDGRLDYKEAHRCLGIDQRTFNEIDTNRSGKINRTEYETWERSRHGRGKHDDRKFDKCSGNDHMLNRAEAQKCFGIDGRTFDRIDTNHSGNITKSEWENYKKTGHGRGRR